ncbi:MAG: chorismate synthase [Bacteroidales bacterium]|nr:chorismate synthase [Bacteroidales bacterium]
MESTKATVQVLCRGAVISRAAASNIAIRQSNCSALLFARLNRTFARMNTFGRIFRFTSFGESHGAAIGGVIDGMPAGIKVDMELIRTELLRRATGSSCRKDSESAESGVCHCSGNYSSTRKEEDNVEFLSGLLNGTTLGTPIAFIIRNKDARSEDYKDLEHLFRPAHADDTYFHKYGIRDHRGGGRASARETAVRVVAGAFAKMLLKQHNIAVTARVAEIGGIKTVSQSELPAKTQAKTQAEPQAKPTASNSELPAAATELLENARKTGDSVGGVIECTVTGAPKTLMGLGEPLYDKLTSRLASAMMSINASRSFEIGQGLQATKMLGSEHNDKWLQDGSTENNYSGGVRGGISTGEPVIMRVGFKPIPSISKEQTMLSDNGELIKHSIHGRHDVTCVFRAVPVVEAMAAVCIADFLLLKNS